VSGESKVFLGEFKHTIDEKGRVSIPPRFKGALKEGVVLTPGVERCINLYPLAEWQKVAATLTTGSVERSKTRRLNRAIFATAFRPPPIDKQGRIALPVPLRDYAGIEDEVIIAGVNTYLELWNKEQWEEERAISQEQAWQIIESLEQHG